MKFIIDFKSQSAECLTGEFLLRIVCHFFRVLYRFRKCYQGQRNSIRRYANSVTSSLFSLWFTEYRLGSPLSRKRFVEVYGFWCTNAFYSTIVAVVPVNSRLHSQYRVLSRQVCWIDIYAKPQDRIRAIVLSKSLTRFFFGRRGARVAVEKF